MKVLDSNEWWPVVTIACIFRVATLVTQHLSSNLFHPLNHRYMITVQGPWVPAKDKCQNVLLTSELKGQCALRALRPNVW